MYNKMVDYANDNDREKSRHLKLYIMANLKGFAIIT